MTEGTKPAGSSASETQAGSEYQAGVARARPAKQVRRDNFTWPFSTAAEKHPDASTLRFFWVVALVGVAMVALDLSVATTEVDLKLGSITVPVKRSDAMTGMKIALALFSAIYLILSGHEVASWIRESNKAFLEYQASHKERWEKIHPGQTIEPAKRSVLDVIFGGLKMCFLLVPLIGACVSALLLRS